MKPACRKCKRRFVILDEVFKRTAKQNASYAEKDKVNEKLLEETSEVNKKLERIIAAQEIIIQEKEKQMESLQKENINLEKIFQISIKSSKALINSWKLK